MNLYGYVQNDPINWIDPEGLQGQPYNSEQNALIEMLKEIRDVGKGISQADAKAAESLAKECKLSNVRVDLNPRTGSMGPHLNAPIRRGHIPLNDLHIPPGGGGRPGDLR